MANIIISEKYLRALLDEINAYAGELDDAQGYCNQSLGIQKEHLGTLWDLGKRALAANKHGRVVKGQLQK